MRINVDYREVTLQPRDTVDALIRLYNRHDLTHAQMVRMRHLVYAVNGGRDVFPVGDVIKIPTVYVDGRAPVPEGSAPIDETRAVGAGMAAVEDLPENVIGPEELSVGGISVRAGEDLAGAVERLADVMGMAPDDPALRRTAAYRALEEFLAGGGE